MPTPSAHGPLICLMALLVAGPVSAQHTDLLQALRNEAHTIAATTPMNSICDPSPAPNTCLMRSVSGSGDFLHSTYDPNRIGELAAAWALPAEVAQQLSWIVIAEQVTFTTFSFVMTGHHASMSEYVGAACRVNGVAEVGVLRAHATATMHNRYSVTQSKQLSRSMCDQIRASLNGCKDYGSVAYCGVTYGKPPTCRATQYSHPRGYTADELLVIQQAMRAAAYQHITRLLGV